MPVTELPRNFLASPYYFMCVSLHESSKGEISTELCDPELAGTQVSSLHRVKDTENLGGYSPPGVRYLDVDRVTEVGYFVFQDLSIRKEGEYCLKYNLFEIQR